jgi:hypothetical protein
MDHEPRPRRFGKGPDYLKRRRVEISQSQGIYNSDDEDVDNPCLSRSQLDDTAESGDNHSDGSSSEECNYADYMDDLPVPSGTRNEPGVSYTEFERSSILDGISQQYVPVVRHLSRARLCDGRIVCHAKADIDSICVISSSLYKLVHRINMKTGHMDLSTSIRFENVDRSSRICIRCSGSDEESIPVYRPCARLTDRKCTTVRLRSFHNALLAVISNLFGK